LAVSRTWEDFLEVSRNHFDTAGNQQGRRRARLPPQARPVHRPGLPHRQPARRRGI